MTRKMQKENISFLQGLCFKVTYG